MLMVIAIEARISVHALKELSKSPNHISGQFQQACSYLEVSVSPHKLCQWLYTPLHTGVYIYHVSRHWHVAFWQQRELPTKSPAQRTFCTPLGTQRTLYQSVALEWGYNVLVWHHRLCMRMCGSLVPHGTK